MKNFTYLNTVHPPPTLQDYFLDDDLHLWIHDSDLATKYSLALFAAFIQCSLQFCFCCTVHWRHYHYSLSLTQLTSYTSLFSCALWNKILLYLVVSRRLQLSLRHLRLHMTRINIYGQRWSFPSSIALNPTQRILSSLKSKSYALIAIC